MKKKSVSLSVGRGEKLPTSRCENLNNWMSDVWTCCTCKESKPLSMYYKNSSSKNGYQNICKECDKIRTKARDKRKSNESLPFFFKRLISGRMASMGSKYRRRGWGGKLTVDLLMDKFNQQGGKCAISGIEMTHIAGKGKVKTNVSIDRIESSLGYEPDNIQLVCYIVNIIKNDFSKEDLIYWCKKIIENGNTENN